MPLGRTCGSLDQQFFPNSWEDEGGLELKDRKEGALKSALQT
jgi:hypothetical protein